MNVSHGGSLTARRNAASIRLNLDVPVAPVENRKIDEVGHQTRVNDYLMTTSATTAVTLWSSPRAQDSSGKPVGASFEDTASASTADDTDKNRRRLRMPLFPPIHDAADESSHVFDDPTPSSKRRRLKTFIRRLVSRSSSSVASENRRDTTSTAADDTPFHKYHHQHHNPQVGSIGQLID